MNEKMNMNYINNLDVLRSNIWKLHWNVTGPLFFPLHHWYDEVYHELVKIEDTVAEHMKGIGLNPLSEMTAEGLSIVPIKSKDIDAQESVEYVKKELEKLSKMTSDMIQESKKINDNAGENIYMDIAQYVGKQLYCVNQMLK